jgi:hypothetical protein
MDVNNNNSDHNEVLPPATTPLCVTVTCDLFLLCEKREMMIRMLAAGGYDHDHDHDHDMLHAASNTTNTKLECYYTHL